MKIHIWKKLFTRRTPAFRQNTGPLRRRLAQAGLSEKALRKMTPQQRVQNPGKGQFWTHIRLSSFWLFEKSAAGAKHLFSKLYHTICTTAFDSITNFPPRSLWKIAVDKRVYPVYNKLVLRKIHNV